MTAPLSILIGCETSGVMRRAFAALGHDVWSCDLLPAEDGSNRHITGDVRDHLADGWDMLIVAHPPCTRLCNSGVRWLHTPPARPHPRRGVAPGARGRGTAPCHRGRQAGRRNGPTCRTRCNASPGA